MGLAGAGAPEIRRGDHACSVFTSDDERARLASAFARTALARGDRVLYVADQVDEQAVVAFLDEVGLDGRALMYAGALHVLPSTELGLEDGFDRDRQAAVWDMLISQARGDGYGGLGVLAEMTWSQRWNVDPDVLIDYEAASARNFASGEFSAICMYDGRMFDTDVLAGIRDAHPLCLSLHDHGYSVDYARLHLEAGAPGSFRIGGEIDLANVDFFEAQLWDQLRGGDAVADLSELAFVDVAGCRLLRQASQGAIGNGRLRIENAPPILTRVMNLCEWADGPPT